MIQLEAAGGHLYAGIKILQDGLHFSAPQVPHMGHLGHVLVMCPILGHIIQSVYKIKGLKYSPGWVTLVYLTCTSIEVLEVHIDSVPHFEVHNSINQ